MVDIVLLGTAILIPFLPYIILFSSLYFCFDPYYFVLGDLFGVPSFQNKPLFEYTIMLILRGFVASCGFECSRTISYGIMVLILVLNRLYIETSLIISAKITSLRSLLQKFSIFRALSIISTNLRSTSEEIFTFFITAEFWALVIASYLIIRAREEVPMYMYGMIVISWVISSVQFLTALTILSIFSARSVVLIWRLNKETRMLYACSGNLSERRNLLIMKKKAFAFTPIRLYFYPFIPIDEQFCKDTLRNQLGRTFDAILMFR